MTDQTLTELTQLRLSTNWTSCTNFSPGTLFSLIPPTSALSLSPSVNFSIPLIPYYNPSCLGFNLEYNISPNHSAIPLSSVDTIEQSFKQEIEGKVIPTGSYSSKVFSKDPSPMSIPIYPWAIMFYPGSPGTSYFEGSHITDFLNSYSQMYIDHQVDKHKKIMRLSWYYELFIGKYIETLISSSKTS